MFLFIYFERERQRACAQGRGRERKGERIPSRLHTVSTKSDVGLKTTNHEIMT